MLLQVHSILTVVGAQPLFVVDEGKLVRLITRPEVMTDGFNINCLVTAAFAFYSVKILFYTFYSSDGFPLKKTDKTLQAEG